MADSKRESRFEEEGPGRLPQDVFGTSVEISEDVGDVLSGRERKNRPAAKKMPNAAGVKVQPLAVTLSQYLADLEREKEPSAVERIRRIRLTLMFLGRHFKTDTDKIVVKKLPGNTVGEATSNGVEIDPMVFDNDTHGEEDMALIRNHILAHELTHYEDRIQHEGLTEAKAAKISKDKIRDYEHLVKNVLQVTSILVEGDKDAGISLAVELYKEGKYDELFARFEDMYGKKYPDRVKKNSDVALRVFQLAFPELTVAEEGQFVEDKAGIEEAFAA